MDNSPAALMGGAGLGTWDFTQPYYVNYSPAGYPEITYSNRSAFPPANASIEMVAMFAIVRCNIPRAFQLSAQIRVGDYPPINSPVWTATTTDAYWGYNLTGVLKAWGLLCANDTVNQTYGLLSISQLLHVWIWGDAYDYGRAIYVDYVGIVYFWHWNGTGFSESYPTGTEIGLPDVSGMLGIFGFVGMIAVPAASIWFYRRDGGSKVATAIIALVAFLICFGMFFGVLNG
jgi:hypothetical protein